MSTTAAISDADRNIRLAVPSDADAVFSLLESMGERFVPERSVFDEAFEYAVGHSEDHLLYVADRPGGGVIGYALATIVRLLYLGGYSAQLQEIVVHEDERGNGIGSVLVGTVEDELRARGVRQLSVASIRGAAFYERLDYRSTADYLKKNFDE